VNTAADIERERSASIRLARERLRAFVASGADGIEVATRAAETALRNAVRSGAGVERLSAELELSPRCLRAILDGAVGLRALHPDERLRTS